MTTMRFARALFVAAALTCLALPAGAQDQDIRDDISSLKAQLLQLKVNPYPPPRERQAPMVAVG